MRLKERDRERSKGIEHVIREKTELVEVEYKFNEQRINQDYMRKMVGFLGIGVR